MTEFLQFLKPAESVYTGKVAEIISFIIEKQLTDKALWKKFANQFSAQADSETWGWSGEYWGKMMRGGCLTYWYSGDENLYSALMEAVEYLLATQDELGRISTYKVESEFSGWDLWCRKYVLTGLQHFYKICKEKELKERIIVAMIANADYICEHIGEDKVDIRTTSYCWGSTNSCSILEPFVELYKMTDVKRYLDFAQYIIQSGGCKDGDLLLYASREGCYPYQYPEVKAYETMSFFEGVLAYCEVTKNNEYLEIVKKFVEDAYQTDGTVIGGLGGLEELFDNFTVRQTEPQSTTVQETCVTVTWIRLLTRLFMLTGDKKYVDRIECSSLNALWGTLNTEWCESYSSGAKANVSPLPFDSYSPLVYGRRGREVGGFNGLVDGGHYGCCACIAAAGFALVPLFAVLRQENGFVFNFYFNGDIKTTTPNGKPLNIEMSSRYPVDGKMKISIICPQKECFEIKIRKPIWCETAKLKGVSYTESEGYFIINKEWSGKETIELDFPMQLVTYTQNEKTAFAFGPLILALDEAKGNKNINKEIKINSLKGTIEKAEEKEIFRYRIKGETEDYLFTDYASSGKEWDKTEDKISVWLDVKFVE